MCMSGSGRANCQFTRVGDGNSHEHISFPPTQIQPPNSIPIYKLLIVHTSSSRAPWKNLFNMDSFADRSFCPLTYLMRGNEKSQKEIDKHGSKSPLNISNRYSS